MPYSSEHKQQSRARILQSAFRCFTKQGFENTSIDEVMNEADMTRGAFYAHFSSKSELYQQALLSGALNSLLAQKKPEHYSDEQWMKQLIKGYLSVEHIEQSSSPCPLAFMITDVAVSAPQVRHTYTNVFRRMAKLITKYTRRFSRCKENEIYALTAMLIGSVAIARCLDDNHTRNKLLSSCRTMAHKILAMEPGKT